MANIYYNLFLRNWKACTAQESHIDAAVSKGYITSDEAAVIKATPRECDTTE